MRVLNYPNVKNKARILDLYQKVWGEFELQQGLNELPLTKREFRLKDSWGNTFTIYDGKDILEWNDAIERYDFTKLEAYLLDYYLSNGEFHKHTSEADKTLILQFVEVYNKNLEKGNEYLMPYGFSKLDLQLTQGF